MEPPDIQTMLNDLARFRTMHEDLAQQYETQRLKILASVQPALDAAEQEYRDKQAPVFQAAQELEEEIKRAVLQQEASTQGTALHAIYTKGKVTWDGKALHSYAETHPEIKKFSKVGKPSVSIRATKS
jgi:hypothetical protein